jgi:hypothetical protein
MDIFCLHLTLSRIDRDNRSRIRLHSNFDTFFLSVSSSLFKVKAFLDEAQVCYWWYSHVELTGVDIIATCYLHSLCLFQLQLNRNHMSMIIHALYFIWVINELPFCISFRLILDFLIKSIVLFLKFYVIFEHYKPYQIKWFWTNFNLPMLMKCNETFKNQLLIYFQS